MLALVLSVCVRRPCPADMVVTESGKVRVGRIKPKDDGDLRLTTGTASRKRSLTIASGKIQHSYTGREEVEQIIACQEVASLRRWAAGYFHAGLEENARRCLEQALDLDPELGAKLKNRDKSAIAPKQWATTYRRFWNRIAFHRIEANLSKHDATEQLAAAAWAHDAGLHADALRHLRAAWRADRGHTRTSALATRWKVALEPWIRLDLTLALDTPLLTDSIRDEDVVVSASPGMHFLTLPLKYDHNVAPKTLSKAAFKGRDMRGFYGLRCPPVRRGRPELERYVPREPVYERLKLEIPDESEEPDSTRSGKDPETTAEAELVAKNSQGPRRDNLETKRDRPKTRTRSLRPNGWAALIIEVPDSAKRFSFQWADGVEEEVDLDFLRHARDSWSTTLAGDPALRGDSPTLPRAVSAVLKKLTGASGAMAALAIVRLQRLREQVPVDALSTWMAQVEAAVVTSGARVEEDVRAAAWAYFASRQTVPETARAFLGEQDAEALREWITLIEAGTAGRRDTNLPVATELLGAILRTNDTWVCEAALDALLSLRTDLDWGFAEHVSERSQTLTLARLDRVADEASARRLLRVLMKDVHPATADGIAAHAGRLGIRIRSPDDPVLTQWSSRRSTAERESLIRVLAAVPLGDVAYAHRFAEFIREATAPEMDEKVREAAFEMLVSQARFLTDRPEGTGSRPGPSGNFPVLISTEASDPFIEGLAAAATQAQDRKVRTAALAALSLLGYADIAAQCLVDGAAIHDDHNVILQALVDLDDEVSHSDGLPAMLAGLLREEFASSTDFIVSYLLKRGADADESDRWRLLAALKAGIDFERMDRLIAILPQPTSGKLTRWLYALGHMSAQDRRWLSATRDVDERFQRLERIDFRRGYLVNGRYGMLAILETLRAEEGPNAPGSFHHAGPYVRWGAPQRVSVVLPAARLETGNEDETYQVFSGDKLLGLGMLKNRQQLLPPVRYSPRLQDAGEDLLGQRGWGWRDPENSSSSGHPATGPVVLRHRPATTKPAPGTMSLDIGALLRDALREQRVFGEEDPDAVIPESYKITLRYTAFASFYGVGQRQSLPRERPVPGRRHLLNVMVVLERIE